jgi:hypothetical protein
MVSSNCCLHRKHLPHCYGNDDRPPVFFHTDHRTALNLNLLVSPGNYPLETYRVLSNAQIQRVVVRSLRVLLPTATK